MATRVVKILTTIVNESYSSHDKAKGQRVSLCIVGVVGNFPELLHRLGSLLTPNLSMMQIKKHVSFICHVNLKLLCKVGSILYSW